MPPAFDEPRIDRRTAGAARLLHWLDRAAAALDALPADHPDRQLTSGSLRLRALGPSVFGEIVESLRAVAWPPRGSAVEPWPLLAAECWLRVQHPIEARPPGQHPHGWHQDGALGFDFTAAPRAPTAVRRMQTLWLPLVDCGVDAPSLEWIEAPEPDLLWPDELTDAALMQRHGSQPRRHAVLSAGDALLFDGALLHRTHVRPGMTRMRISVELRWTA
jgi:hypothetical protein